MVTLNEAVTALEAANTAIADMETRIEAAFDALEILVEDLRDGSVDQALVDRVQAVADSLQGKVVEFESDIFTGETPEVPGGG